MSTEACPIPCRFERCDAVNLPKCVHSFVETRFVSDQPPVFIPANYPKNDLGSSRRSASAVSSPSLEDCLNPHSYSPASFK